MLGCSHKLLASEANFELGLGMEWNVFVTDSFAFVTVGWNVLCLSVDSGS